MKISLNQRTSSTYKYKSNIAFCSNVAPSTEGDKFVSKSDAYLLLPQETQNNISGLFKKIKGEYGDQLDVAKTGNRVRIPNNIMFEVQNSGDELFPVQWLKKTADSDFVHLTDKNNDDLTDELWEELKKSKELFEQTKRRTLIYVEGFDRLITERQNTFENIDSLKDIMCRTANDFGATIVFSTKDASKLTSEAIQAQRVTRILVTKPNDELEKYNAFLDSHGHFKDYEKRNASKIPETTETTPKPEQPKPTKEPIKTDISTPIKTEQTNIHTNNSDILPHNVPPGQKNGTTNIEIPNGQKLDLDIKPIKAPDMPSIVKKVTDEAPKNSKLIKVIAILVAIGTAIAGIIYFIRNKQKTNQ